MKSTLSACHAALAHTVFGENVRACVHAYVCVLAAVCHFQAYEALLLPNELSEHAAQCILTQHKQGKSSQLQFHGICQLILLNYTKILSEWQTRITNSSAQASLHELQKRQERCVDCNATGRSVTGSPPLLALGEVLSEMQVFRTAQAAYHSCIACLLHKTPHCTLQERQKQS